MADKIHGKPIRFFARLADHGAPEGLSITLLHKAAFDREFKRVKTLIEAGADVNAVDIYGWTPLHDAVISGHSEIVQGLLDAGADIDAQDYEEEYTPLHEAVLMQYPAIEQQLITAGANTLLKDRWGNTASDLSSDMLNV